VDEMKLSHDPMVVHESRAFIDYLISTITYEKLSKVTNAELDCAWRQWLQSSSFNKVTGLDTMKFSAFCPGVTDAFGEFIARYPNRRVRVSRSDFVLTKILCRSWNRECVSLEEGPLEHDDCLVMSLPFSGNGTVYPNWNSILEICNTKNIPVFIDGAYFGISHGVEYALEHPCITDFSVSLSKNLAGNPLRLGIRFTKSNIDDGITAGLIGSDIFDRFGGFISIALLEKFSHDWFVNKYKNASLKVCQDLKLTPTNTLTLALGDNSMLDFQRGDYIRVSISEELSRTS
jgi:hypothetical protein